MPMPRVRIYLTEQGLLHLRQLPPREASITLTTILSRAGSIRAQLIEPARPLWDVIEAELRDLLQHLNALLDANPPAPPPDPEPPPGLLALFEREMLTDRRQLNHLIDALVGALEGILESQASSPIQDARQQDARAAHADLFPDGKRFLSASHHLQWRDVQARFGVMSDATRARLERLELAGDVARIVQVNAWFGDLLGVSRDASDAALAAAAPEDNTLEAIMERFLLTMRRLVGLGNALPDDLTTLEANTLLLSPYLEPVFAQHRQQSKAIRAAQRQSPSDAPEDATPEDTATE